MLWALGWVKLWVWPSEATELAPSWRALDPLDAPTEPPLCVSVFVPPWACRRSAVWPCWADPPVAPSASPSVPPTPITTRPLADPKTLQPDGIGGLVVDQSTIIPV